MRTFLPIETEERQFDRIREPAAPRSLRNPEDVKARRALLNMPHIAPLTAYVEALRFRCGLEFPDFDPLDGGVHARLLFLKEMPGPMTSAVRSGRAGSGFISRDNEDPTAEATFRFMRAAGIPRSETVMWNVVPGWNGTRRITSTELRAGLAEIGTLIHLLPRVRVIVLLGRKAQRSEAQLGETGLVIRRSPHNSPLVRASRPEAWNAIPALWADAYAAAGSAEKG